MFKYKKLTDFEKLVIANDYIKVLKRELRVQEQATKRAIENLENFTEHMFRFSNGTRKLISYRREMQSHAEARRKSDVLNNKLERKNFILREEIRRLKKELETKDT